MKIAAPPCMEMLCGSYSSVTLHNTCLIGRPSGNPMGSAVMSALPKQGPSHTTTSSICTGMPCGFEKAELAVSTNLDQGASNASLRIATKRAAATIMPFAWSSAQDSVGSRSL
eukprot:617414-Pelagomonas_calceolata.AAC.1